MDRIRLTFISFGFKKQILLKKRKKLRFLEKKVFNNNNKD